MIHSYLEALAAVPFFSTPAFGIIAMVIVGGSWCLVGLVMGDAPKKGIDPGLIQFFGALFAGTVSLIMMFATGSVPHCSPRIIVMTCGLIGLANFMNFYMLLLMSYAMQRGPNGVIWAIIQSAFVFPFIAGILFFNVQFTVLRGIGIICLLGALVLFGLTKDNSRNQKGWRIPAFAALGITALVHNCMTTPSYFQEARTVNSIVRALAANCGVLLGAIVYSLVKLTPEYKAKLLKGVRSPALWRYVAALQFFSLFFAYTLHYPGMNAMADAGLGGMCYPVMVGSCIVTFTLTAVLLLKEKLSFIQAAALTVCIGGLIMICLPVAEG